MLIIRLKDKTEWNVTSITYKTGFTCGLGSPAIELLVSNESKSIFGHPLRYPLKNKTQEEINKEYHKLQGLFLSKKNEYLEIDVTNILQKEVEEVELHKLAVIPEKSKPASLWELTCPHCQAKDQAAIHFAATTINDLQTNFACHCHACKKPFSAVFGRVMTSTVPIPKCYNMKISNCSGCPYYPCETKMTAGANTTEGM